MVQNSQSLYSFTFNTGIVTHEYIYSHSTAKFTFKKYIYSHLTMNFLFTDIFTRIYKMSSFTFNNLYSFTTRSKYSFNIFCAPPLRSIRFQLPHILVPRAHDPSALRRNRELWGQPFQACAIDVDYVKPDGQNSVISFVISKWLLPELSFSDRWSRGTRLWERDWLPHYKF